MSAWLNPRPILDLINEYLEILKNLTEEEFCLQQEDSPWSPSEVYCHIIQVNLRSLLAIEKCIYGKPHQKGYGIPVVSRLILYFGRFPPGKINIPQKMVEMVKVITREEAKNDLIKFTGKLKELLPKISKCPSYQRIMHPRLGMLNCSEWLRFIEIYSRYHLKKLKKQISASSRQSG